MDWTTTMGQFNTTLAGARARLPIADAGFLVNPSLLETTLGTEDLTTTLGWQLLLTRIAATIFILPPTPVGGVRSAVVPNSSTYALNGIAAPFAPIRTFIARATLGATCAHEISHLGGLNHAPCGSPPPPIDPRLPGSTEDVGMNVPLASTTPNSSIVPAGTGELMSLCGGQARWPSIVLYSVMRGAWPL